LPFVLVAAAAFYTASIQSAAAQDKTLIARGRYLVNGEVPGGFGQSFTWEGIRTLTLEDGVLHGRVVLSCNRPVTINAAPHQTVSQSEAGFEKIMQAVTLKVSNQPQATETLMLTLTVEPMPD
jgi:hypothetical protein